MKFYTNPNLDSTRLEKSVLILFKFPSRWNAHILRKFSINFNVYWSFINDSYQQLGSFDFSSEILKFSSQQNIVTIILDIEFYPCFHIATIDLLRAGKPKVGLMVFDDGPLHLVNRILASRVDFILAACPISNLKYQEMGFSSTWIPLESDSLYFRQNNEKKIDILFFGNTTCTDRPHYLTTLQNVKGRSIVIFDPAIYGQLDQSGLAEMLASAKLIINFSKSDILTSSAFPPRPSNFVYQLKGRVAETLFSGSICISEYAPQHHLLNINNFLDEFKNPDEMIDRIESFNYSDNAVKQRYEDFYNDCWPKFCDVNCMNKIDLFLDEIQIIKKNKIINNKSLIDVNYFLIVKSVLINYFAHNTTIYEQELALLDNC